MKKILLLLPLVFLLMFTVRSQTPTLIKDINTSVTDDGTPENLTVYNGYTYFAKEDNVNGKELWRTDGSATELVMDIHEGAESSSTSSFTIYNGELYFAAIDTSYYFNGSPSLTIGKSSLWKTDGTDVTRVVKHITVNIGSSLGLR